MRGESAYSSSVSSTTTLWASYRRRDAVEGFGESGRGVETRMKEESAYCRRPAVSLLLDSLHFVVRMVHRYLEACVSFCWSLKASLEICVAFVEPCSLTTGDRCLLSEQLSVGPQHLESTSLVILTQHTPHSESWSLCKPPCVPEFGLLPLNDPRGQ